MRKTIILLFACSIALYSCTQPKIIGLSLDHKADFIDADQETLNSIQKVGNLYTVTYYGDYSERLEWLNDYHITESSKLANKRTCSLFATYSESQNPLLGRNFDRIKELPVVAKFSAPGKYESFAFSPGSEVFINDVIRSTNPTEEQKGKFLTCLPFYATDGINEKGLSIAIAGAPPRQVKASEQRGPMFVLLFIRHVLDNCSNVDEVASFAETVALYDSDMSTISHHFIVMDASGQWLVIDYPDGNLRIIRGNKESQARTNHFLEGGPAIDNTSFRRYDILKQALSSQQLIASESEAMRLLKQARHDTQWSVVYNSKLKTGLFAVRENYSTQYKFGW